MVIPALVMAWLGAVAAPGAWPEPRQNSQLTAVQPVPGRMAAAPVVLAEHDLGRAPAGLHAVKAPGGGDWGLALVHGALHCYAADGSLQWTSHPPGLNYVQIAVVEDLNGDGTVEIALRAGRPADPYGAAVLVDLASGDLVWRYDVEPMSYAWYLFTGHYLPGVASKQLIVLMHGYPPDAENGYIALFDYAADGPVPAQRWRYDFDAYTCFPTLQRSDVDGDGVEELGVQTHSRMWLIDPVTGAKEQFIEWDVSPGNVRSYGLTEFVDLDGDGREDFLCIANFAQHHEVLLNRDGTLEKAWHYGWDESVTTGKVATTWPEPPYADVDGDGAMELVVSMFNARGDSAWAVRVYAMATGTIEYEHPGLIAAALRDLNEDGRAEILADASDDPAVASRTGGIEAGRGDGAVVLAVRDGALAEVWRDPAAEAVRSRDANGPHIRRRDGAYRVRMASATMHETPYEAPPPTPGPDFSAVPDLVGPALPDLLAADFDGDGINEVLVYTQGQAHLYNVGAGRLHSIGTYPSGCLPAVADFDGDGVADLAVVEAAPDRRPRVAVVAPGRNNATIWETELPQPPQAGLPAPRVAYLRTGNFLGRGAPDLYAWIGTPTVRSVVLHGATGQLVWEKTEFEGIERYYGPSVDLAAAYDFDGDGCDDLVFTNPDYYCVADGPTGAMLLGPLFPPNIFDQPSQGLYTLPAILAGADGPPTVVLAAGHYFQAAMSVRADPYWYKLPVAGESPCAAEGFLAQDGTWLMGFGRQNGQFACVEVEDGTLRWEHPLEASASDPIACDVDGDGQMEFVVATSHGTLVAVGDRDGAPAVVWETMVNAGLGAPIAADVTGDGASELIVAGHDGRVRVFGAAAP